VTAAVGPGPDTAARRDRLRSALDVVGIDLLLVTASPNVAYLTGFTGSNGQLLLAPDASGDRLITDDRYTERAATEAPDLPVVSSRDVGGVAVTAARVAGSRLGVEADDLRWAAAERLQATAAEHDVEVVATSDLVEVLRAVKDDHEIALLDRACRITTAALTELLTDRLVPGATERDLAVWLERRFVDLGADGVAFPSIVASGPNGAVPHHAPTDRAVVRGDLVTVDCGAQVGGYHADCTRTVAVGPDTGAVAGVLVEVHAVVAAAQAAGRLAAVAGARACDVDAAARQVVTDAGYGSAFVHGTGHGVGLEIHEAPAVARGSGATLSAGTALTVEPGVYLPGTGGVRIEDTIVVTADGAPRVLTDIPRSLRVA
jgi:Xaa-Pro aminopeptidase